MRGAYVKEGLRAFNNKPIKGYPIGGLDDLHIENGGFNAWYSMMDGALRTYYIICMYV